MQVDVLRRPTRPPRCVVGVGDVVRYLYRSGLILGEVHVR
jgi:hypothetical protein